jgi:exosome complex RNA-binding protein Csl4
MTLDEGRTTTTWRGRTAPARVGWFFSKASTRRAHLVGYIQAGVVFAYCGAGPLDMERRAYLHKMTCGSCARIERKIRDG